MKKKTTQNAETWFDFPNIAEKAEFNYQKSAEAKMFLQCTHEQETTASPDESALLGGKKNRWVSIPANERWIPFSCSSEPWYWMCGGSLAHGRGLLGRVDKAEAPVTSLVPVWKVSLATGKHVWPENLKLIMSHLVKVTTVIY